MNQRNKRISSLQRQLQKIQSKAMNNLLKLVAIRNTVDDVRALQQMFFDLMDKLIDGYKLAFLATGDTQRIREHTTGGTFVKLDKSEILSETIKQKMNDQRQIKKGNSNLRRFPISRFNSSERVTQNQNSQRQMF
ncbi:MAG: hypothetical protein EZS28_051136 [Streblomastix strix]|uniref:Uncharacterized protein n=1 Tax=Streblomastix strix TaxID=222440 RepID=A0A5J4T544_9EUKA|nr:MAG: hypothetical protein EZS28_051136 [Streblomastix strix]